MVVINSGIMQNQIIKIVEGCKDYKYTYVKKMVSNYISM